MQFGIKAIRRCSTTANPFLDANNHLATSTRENRRGRIDENKLPVEEEGLLEGAAEAGLLVPEPGAGAAMLSGAVYAAAPVQVPPIAVPLVDIPGREPQEGERVREGHRIGE